jgi:CcmD family protein
MATILLGVAAGLLPMDAAYAGDGVSYQSAYQDSIASSQHESEDSDPEANLPYLFAVFIVTWAVFFGYVFYTARSLREMQRELHALRAALSEKERLPGQQ